MALTLTPLPSALLMRAIFDTQADKTNLALAKHVPDGIVSITGLQYDLADNDAWLDVYHPAALQNTDSMLPVIVWIHGGGLISGNRTQIGNYCKILASYGYTTVSIDYSVAPESKYPIPIRQTNAALAYLKKNASTFHIDSTQFVLAGDSGGSHIAAQMACLITDTGYVKVMNIQPAIASENLMGLILFCGSYNALNVELKGIGGWFFKTVLWAYSGTNQFKKDAYFQTASVVDYVTEKFPPAFISAGNGDPLLSHSRELVRKLNAKQIAPDTLFFAEHHSPALPHEYQFNLDTEAGRLALDRAVQFLQILRMKTEKK